MGDLTSAIIAAESSGNPYARNSRSSAAGLGQFIDSTWLATVKKHRPDVAAGKTPAQLLQLKFDPALSREMTNAYAADNQGYLRTRGIDPTPGNTYLAHFAGPQGAAAIHGNPRASAEELLGARAVAANPFLRGKTGADVINWAAGKVDGKKGAPMATIPGVAPKAMPVAGTTGTPPGLPDFGRLPSERRRQMAEALLSQSFRTAGSATNPLGALAAMAQAGVGSYLGGKYDDEKASRNKKLAEALLGASDNEALMRTMFASGDDDLVKAATSAKIAGMKPKDPVELAPGATLYDPKTREAIYTAPARTPNERRYVPTRDGIYDAETGQWLTNPSKGGVQENAGTLGQGERWRMKGGQMETDASGRPIAEPIPGSSKEAVAAEVAARVGLADTFLNRAADVRQKIADGKLGWGLDFALNRGEPAAIYRDMQEGSEALIRNLTGAGMNETEAKSYAERYLPTNTDRLETVLAKFDGLVRALRGVKQRVLIGRGEASVDTPPSAQTPPPQAEPFNPEDPLGILD